MTSSKERIKELETSIKVGNKNTDFYIEKAKKLEEQNALMLEALKKVMNKLCSDCTCDESGGWDGGCDATGEMCDFIVPVINQVSGEQEG